MKHTNGMTNPVSNFVSLEDFRGAGVREKGYFWMCLDVWEGYGQAGRTQFKISSKKKKKLLTFYTHNIVNE
jgi:hypothetical protein